MSCRCENQKRASDLDNIRRLAKALARIEEATVAIVLNEDGTYGFCVNGPDIAKPIVELVTRY